MIECMVFSSLNGDTCLYADPVIINSEYEKKVIRCLFETSVNQKGKIQSYFNEVQHMSKYKKYVDNLNCNNNIYL